MVKNSGKLKRADRRAPEPDLKIDLATVAADDTAETATATPYKPYQHSAASNPAPAKKKAASNQALGKSSRAKREKAIARADKVNAKFLTNKAKAERKKLMKS